MESILLLKLCSFKVKKSEFGNLKLKISLSENNFNNCFVFLISSHKKRSVCSNKDKERIVIS